MKKLLLSSLLLLIGLSMAKAKVIEIGVGSEEETSVYLPIGIQSRYSLTQQIYTAEEMGAETVTLTSISFYNTTTTCTRDIEIYLSNDVADGENLNDAFGRGFDYGDQVFSGQVVFYKGKWTAIPLSSAFLYAKGTSLLVTVVDKTGLGFILDSWHGITTYPMFLTYKYEGDAALARYSSGNKPYNRSYMGRSEGQTSEYKNQVRFNETWVVPQITGFHVEKLTFSNATIAWNDMLDLDEFTIQCKRSEATEWSGFNTKATSTSFDIDSDAESYDVRLQAHTITGIDTEWAELTFSTAMEPTDITFSNVRTTSATVSWESMGEVWDFQYKLADKTAWQGVMGLTERSYTLENLQENTVYDVRIRTTDGDERHSSWTTASFQTAEPYPHPTNLRVLSTSYFSAVLAWDENGDAKAWQLCLNDDEEHLIEAKNNHLFTLRGLESDKGYAVKVRAVVEEGSTYSYTRWSDAIGVYTDNIEWERPSGIEVAAKSSTATISWQGSSDSYTLNYWTAPKVLSEGQSEWKTYGDTGEVPGINFNQWYNFVQVAISPELTGVTEGTIFECDYYAEMAIGNENFSVGYSTTTAEYDKTGVFYWNDGGYLEEGASGYRHFQTELPEGVKYVGISFLSNYNDNIIITNVKITSPAGYWQSLETDNRKIEIGGLERGCTYECQVVGHKQGLNDLESEVATFTTEKNSAFSDDFVVSTTATSARISWDSDFNTYKLWYRQAGTPNETVCSANFNENMDGWTVYTQSTETSEYHWRQNSAYKHGGSGSGVVSINMSSSSGCDDWLISPKIPLYGYATFYVTGDNYPGMYEVLLSTTGTNRQDFTTELRSIAQAPSSWTKVTVYYDSPEYIGKEGYIAIRHRSNGTKLVAIDDFEAIVWGKAAGEWQNIDTDKTEVLIEGLEPNTKYEYFVYGYQWDDETTSVMSGIKKFTTAGDAVELALLNNGDNTEDIMLYDGVYANVRIDQLHLKKDGEWQTICLPFDVDVERSVLKDATVRTIESMRAKNGVLIVNCLTDVTQMKAGTPYIIRWNEGEDIQDPVFNGVTIVNNYPNISLEYSSFSFFSYYNAAKPDWISFLKLGEGGMVVPFTMEDDMYAFSAYFFVDEVYQASMHIEDVILNTGDNEDLITGLENLKDFDDEKDIIYNVAGQRLQKMQRGINIVGGKKVLVK